VENMIKGTYDQLVGFAGYNLCSEHKTPLVVAWHGSEGCWTLRCGKGHYPDAITRQPSQTELFKQGRQLEDHYNEETIREEEKRMVKEQKQSTAITMGGVPAADLGTGELLLPEQVKALVAYAHKYGLDPGRDHVVVMYSKPYITIDGYLYYAFISGKQYKMQSRPLTNDEWKTYQIPDGSHAWVCEIIFDEDRQSRIGLGIVTWAEITAVSTKSPGQLRSPVVAKHPWQLAQKRAEWQALRRAFPIAWTDTENDEKRD